MCFSSKNLGFGELYIVVTCKCIYAGSFAGIGEHDLVKPANVLRLLPRKGAAKSIHVGVETQVC